MGLKIHDVRGVCDDGRHREVRDEKRKGIAIHHFGVDGITDAAGMAQFFRENKEWTGGQMPYNVVVLPSGRIELALSLDEFGPHARRWSVPMMSCCFLGNFDKDPPTSNQWFAGVDVLSEMSAIIGAVNLVAHDKLEGGSGDPKKKCPGDAFDVGELSAIVSNQVKDNAKRRFYDSLVIG